MIFASQFVAGEVYHKVITTSWADTTAGWLVGNRRDICWMGKNIRRRHSPPYPWYTALLECGAKKLSRYSDSLRAERFAVRTPVGTRFSATVQAGCGAHLASRVMGTGSLSGVKRTVREVEHPPPCSAEVKGRLEQYLYSTSVPSWQATETTVLQR